MSNIGKFLKLKLLFEANKSLLKLNSKIGSICWKNLWVGILFTIQMPPMLAWKMDLQRVVLSFLWQNEQNTSYMLVIEKLDRVIKNPLASETLAFSEAADTGVLIAGMLLEIFRLPSLPVVLCKTDNVSLVETLKSSNLVSEQHLKVDVALVKEMMVEEEIQS